MFTDFQNPLLGQMFQRSSLVIVECLLHDDSIIRGVFFIFSKTAVCKGIDKIGKLVFFEEG